MPILDIQRRFRELGRIRTGHSEQATSQKTGKTFQKPMKLARFRLTSTWEHLLVHAAEAFGGEVRPWENDGEKQFELFVEAEKLDVLIPPGVDVMEQWYERWQGGGLMNRCDGIRQVLVDQACRCPSDPVERAELAKGNPPKACKPTTRIRVMIPAIPDLGIWRLETHGFHAAAELAGAAELVAVATRQGTLVPAELRLQKREGSRRPGQPRKSFFVPALAFTARLGDVFEALGYLEAGSETPVYLPGVERRAELTEGGTGELPPAGTPFDAGRPVESAEMPGQPPAPETAPEPTESVPSEPAEPIQPSSEPIPVPEAPAAAEPPPTPGPMEPPPADPASDGPRYTGPQLIAMRCDEAGVVDRSAKLRLVGVIVGHPVGSAKDLDAAEIRTVLDWLDDPDVTMVQRANAGPPPEPPADPAPPGDELPPPEPEVLVPDQVLDEIPEAPPPPGQWDGNQWRAHLAANGVKATEVVGALENYAQSAGVDRPRTFEDIRDAPDDVAVNLAEYIEAKGRSK